VAWVEHTKARKEVARSGNENDQDRNQRR